MRLYQIHRMYYIAYVRAQDTVDEILNEHEVLIQRVQPKSPLAEHEREHLPSNPPAGGTQINKAEEYAIQMEQKNIRERLKYAREVLDDRLVLLKQKEEELRRSKDIYNVIYTLKWVDGMKVESIVDITGYSRSQVYNIIRQLTRQLERG